jgi:hypothetical protein
VVSILFEEALEEAMTGLTPIFAFSINFTSISLPVTICVHLQALKRHLFQNKAGAK